MSKSLSPKTGCSNKRKDIWGQRRYKGSVKEAASRNTSCLPMVPRGEGRQFLFSSSPLALEPQGGWKPSDGLLEMVTQAPEGGTPTSKQRVDTSSQVTTVPLRCPGYTQPSWPLAQRQERNPPRRWGLQGEQPEQRGKVGMRFPSRTERG